MKICYTSDLHARPGLYHQLTELIEQERPDVLLLGGDQCTTRLDEHAIDAQRMWLRGPFRAFLERVRPICRVFWASGNHDLAGALDVLVETPDLITNLDMCPAAIGDGWSAVSFPYGPVSRVWPYKDWERRDTNQSPPLDSGARFRVTFNGVMEAVDADTLYGDYSPLASLLSSIPDSDRLILIAHYPPRSTDLDQSAFGSDAGSDALAAHIHHCLAPITFHGHIHESPYRTGRWATRIGGVLSINPGQFGRRLHAVLFNTEDIEGSLLHTIFGGTDALVPLRSAWSIRWLMYRKWRKEGIVPPLYRIALRSVYRRLRRFAS